MLGVAFIDGSFNQVTGTYGAGVFVAVEGIETKQFKCAGNEPALCASRNVAGEVLAFQVLIEYAKTVPDLDELVIYYDYAGIECWPTRKWKANSLVAKLCVSVADTAPCKLKFKKVKAHSGNQYNDLVDRLAKEAAGVI